MKEISNGMATANSDAALMIRYHYMLLSKAAERAHRHTDAALMIRYHYMLLSKAAESAHRHTRHGELKKCAVPLQIQRIDD